MIEHRLIEKTIELIRMESERVQRTGRIDVVLLGSMLDFMRNYADRCHHGKEEDILFKVLAEKEMSVEHREMMGRLVEDHRRSRALSARLGDLRLAFLRGERTATEEVVEVLQSLVTVYPDHIEKEDKLFFPAAMMYLTAEERDNMLKEFEEFDRRLIHEHYRTEVENMKVQMGIVQ